MRLVGIAVLLRQVGQGVSATMASSVPQNAIKPVKPQPLLGCDTGFPCKQPAQ